MALYFKPVKSGIPHSPGNERHFSSKEILKLRKCHGIKQD